MPKGTTRGSHKKESLLEAAYALFTRKGVNETTLADIAALSEVPLGNVYYYFKTKSSIVSAVIPIRFKLLQELLAKIDEENTTPDLQIKSFIQQFLNIAQEEEQNLGAMLTMLYVELSKESDTHENANLLAEFLPLPKFVIEWCTKKFEALGKGENAKKYAVGLLATLIGACSMKKDAKAKEIMPLQVNFIEQAIGIST